MTKPITPNEAKKSTSSAIPSFVIEAFNEMISTRLRRGVARFDLKEVADLAMSKAPPGFERQTLWDRNYMDVEPLFERAGWKVQFDKPGYCESYEAFFVFRAPRTRSDD